MNTRKNPKEAVKPTVERPSAGEVASAGA